MSRLILSHIPDDFNPGTDIAAGAWCFMCRPKDFVYWGRLNFLDDPGESGLDRREILQQCVDFGERLLPEIARRLNAVNETQYSIHFWRRMTDWWLISLLQIMFLAQHKSLALKIAYGHLPLSVELLPYNIPWDFASTRDFNNRAVKRVEFFSWMLSRFIEASPGDAWCTRYRQDSESLSSTTSASKIGQIKEWVREQVWRLRVRMYPRCVGVYGLRGWRALLVSLTLSAKPPVKRSIHLNSAEERARVQPVVQSNQIIHVLDEKSVIELAWQVMPATFKCLGSIPSARWKYRPGSVRVVGPTICTMDMVKYAVAQAREAGEIIIGSQHGAGYGDTMQSIVHFVEFNLDGFITWGWRSHPFCKANFIPLPSPLLSRRSHCGRSEELLFIGASAPLVRQAWDNWPETRGIFNYLFFKETFLIALGEKLIEKVLYRPQLGEGNLNELPFLQARFPNLRILDVLPEKRLYSSRLVILDNPSTMLSISLAANVPTICFWKPVDWEMTDEANMLYGRLNTAGILHSDPASAARKVQEIWPDVQGWWASENVQAARREWCREHAYSSPHWLWIWIRTLWQLELVEEPV